MFTSIYSRNHFGAYPVLTGRVLLKYLDIRSKTVGQHALQSGGGGLVTKLCPTLAILWTVDHQAPLSMGFSRQQFWSGLPFPSPSAE